MSEINTYAAMGPSDRPDWDVLTNQVPPPAEDAPFPRISFMPFLGLLVIAIIATGAYAVVTGQEPTPSR